jgi:branched-chain amino acid transport system substrate-binding protein
MRIGDYGMGPDEMRTGVEHGYRRRIATLCLRGSRMMHSLSGRRFVGLVLVLATAVMPTWSMTASTALAQPKKGALVGFVTELSGPGSVYGEPALQAAQLAVDEVNSAGGVLGGELKLQVADDATDPNVARQVWEKLVAQGVNVILFRETSAARVAAISVAEKANIPAIYPNDYEGGDCRPIMYVAGEIEPQKLPAYLKWLMDKSANKKVFMIGTDYNWTRITEGMVRKALPTLGAQMVAVEYVPFSTTDFAPLITKIRDSGADILFSGLVGGPNNIAFFKQARAAGLLQQLKAMGNEALDDSTLAAVGAPAQGTFMTASYFESVDTPGNKRFLAALKRKFGSSTKHQGYLSEPSYDAIHLYALAVKQAGTTKAAPVLKALSEVTFTGSPKGTIHMTADRHAAMPIYIAEATSEGAYKVIKSLGVQVPPRQCTPYPPFGM